MSAAQPPAAPRAHPPHRPVRRILARACLFACLAALIATPTLFQPTPHDAAIQAAQAQHTDQRQRLLASGASPEALDLHHDTTQTHLDTLRIGRRVNFYARATLHFGATLGLLLGWRALREPAAHRAAANTGSSASHSV